MVAGDPLTTSVAAVVSKDGGHPKGTAFFLGPDVALTCSHVIRDLGPDDIRLVLVPHGQPDGNAVDFAGLPRIEVVAVDDDPNLDLALLRVHNQPDVGRLPLSADWDLGDDVFSRGYHKPVGTYAGGDPVSGKIVGEGPVGFRGRQSHLLTLEDIVVERGISGGPLVHRLDGGVDAALGVIRIKAGAERAHAIPAATVLARWPGLTSVAQDDADAGPEPHFEQLVESGGPTLDGWSAFEPGRMHCVVVESEAGRDAIQPLRKLIPTTLANGEARAWESFQDFWHGRRLVHDGSLRLSPDAPTDITTASFNVIDAFSSLANLDEAVRLVVEADVGVFDVTGFEPGIMLLLGVRAATRRGVTIVSHGGGWELGQPLQRPFNLADLSIASHTREGMADPDPREEMMLKWVEEGYRQMMFQPRYLDTPAYESVRDLGPEFRAWTPIPLAREVIVLCSFGKDFYPVWLDLRNEVRQALKEKLGVDERPNVARVQDVSTPQLISQLLYEKVRRCDGCIGDWTHNSASTFFEIGVRLATSPKSLVQTVERSWLDNDEYGELTHIELMRQLFSPLEYRKSADGTPFDPTIGARVAAQLVELASDLESLGHPIRNTVVDAVRRTEQQRPSLHDNLAGAADALHHFQRVQDDRNTGTQSLFSDVAEIKVDSETAALDFRVAAWLFLEYRLNAGDEIDGELKATWQQLGRLVSTALYDVNFELAVDIEQKVGRG